jgi:1-acyl-sn-glycerol-3-phosphate acyltransferase
MLRKRPRSAGSGKGSEKGERVAGDKKGPWYRFAEAVLVPPNALLTRREWSGLEHIPRTGGAVIAVNHISHLDPLTFAFFVHRTGRAVKYLSKAELFEPRFAGRVLTGTRQIPVYRGSENAAAALRGAMAAVRNGECLIMHPEATLTRDQGLWPMVGKTGTARIALSTGVPVIPVAQWGVHEILPPYAKRIHVLPRKTIHTKAGPPVDLSDLRGREQTIPLLREATDRIMSAITGLLEDIRGESAPAERFDPRKEGVPEYGDPTGRHPGSTGIVDGSDR